MDSRDTQKTKIFTPRNYQLQAHLYSLFTGFLFLLSGVSERLFRKNLIRQFLSFNGNELIIDLCCANGKGTAILASFLSEGQVYGLDLNPSMIHFAQRRIRKKTNLQFMIADVTRNPFPNNSVDIIVSFLGLHEIPNNHVKNVLIESKRVLKEDGYLFVFDFSVSVNSKKLNFLYKIVRLFEDTNAANFMMIDHIELFKKYGYTIKKKQKYLKGITCAYLLQPIN